MFKDNPFLNTRTIIGFENLVNELLKEANQPKSANYPPYNLYEGKDKYVIEMAVAGFTKDELDIEVADGKLTVSGERKNEDTEEWIDVKHAGLAFRSFKRVFTISENIQIGPVKLKDGVLTITLDVVIPEEKKPRKVKINS
jgi:molecular chaperone IbpA